MGQTITPLMVFSVMYTIREGPKRDAYKFQNVMPANWQYDFIHQHKELLEVKTDLHYNIKSSTLGIL